MSSPVHNKSLWDIMFHSYMQPMFDYINKNKENKLHLEQFGELAEVQKFDTTFEKLEATWEDCRQTLMRSKEEDRDRNLYFRNFFFTFR